MKPFAVSFALFLFSLTAWSQANTILWKVSDTVQHKTSYLLGTFHQFGNSFVDSIPPIINALRQAELAVFESIDDIESTQQMIARRPSSTDIEKHLKKKDLKKLKTIAQHWEVDLYKLRPIEISWKLQQEFIKIKCETVHPNDHFDHMDSYLIYLAQQHNINSIGLETDSLQLQLIAQEFNYPNWKTERKKLQYWIDQMSKATPNIKRCELSRQYRNFAIDYAFDQACEEDVLLQQRNTAWMQTLPTLLSNHNTFVAVGLYHLTKQCGLLEQLKGLGFIVEPVPLYRLGD